MHLLRKLRLSLEGRINRNHDFSAFLGWSAQALSNVENGIKPGDRLISKTARKLGISFEDATTLAMGQGWPASVLQLLNRGGTTNADETDNIRRVPLPGGVSLGSIGAASGGHCDCRALPPSVDQSHRGGTFTRPVEKKRDSESVQNRGKRIRQTGRRKLGRSRSATASR